jgi:hypothetical protein
VGSFAFSQTPPLHPAITKAGRSMSRQWQKWQAYDNMTAESLVEDAFAEGVINTLFMLHDAGRLTETDVTACFHRNIFTGSEVWDAAFKEWSQHSGLKRGQYADQARGEELRGDDDESI